MDALDNLNDDAKEVPQGLKPEEEIARFTVPEHLSDVERVNLFLTGGQLVQQRKGIDCLPALLTAKGRAGWEGVKDAVLSTLKQLDAEAQVAAADGLRVAVQQHALSAADAAECLLPLAIINTRAKDKSDEESEAWLLLLLELLAVVPPDQLLQQVLPLALSCGEVNEPVGSRVVCCRLLGAMAPHLAPAEVSARFASRLLAACQDTDYQVRITAAQQLPTLARVLGIAAAISQLLPELTELLTDDEVQVRMAALSGLVYFCEQLPHEARAGHLLPLARRHMQPLELELPLQRTLADAYPRLLAAIRDDLEPSDAGLMYSCFRHLAARLDVELRRTCALRVSELMGSPLPGSSPSYLHDTWTDLAMDHDEQVRVAVASQLHVVAKQASPSDAARLLRRPLTSLLRDGSPLVREALLAGLPDTLQALCGVDEMHREGLAADIHAGLLVLVGNLGSNWRCQQHLACALPQLPALLCQEALCEHWVPWAFGLLLNGATCVKPAAARGLAHLLHGCRRERPRSELYCRLMRELAWGRSCWARLAFIQLCTAALSVFSCRWFKEHLLAPVMELLADGVPNVRLAALGLLPSLKQTIRLPEDVQQLEQLNSAMSNLMTDNDRDVSQAARSLHATFKRTPLRMTGGAGLLDINGSSSGAAAAEFELSDRAKEEAEAELTLLPEELDKLNLEWCAITAERRGGRRPGLALPDTSSNSSISGGRAAAAKGSTAVSSPASRQQASSLGLAASGLGSTSSVSIANSAATYRAGAAGSSGNSLGPWTTESRTGSSTSAYDRRFGSGTASTSSTSSPTSSTSAAFRSAGAAAAAAASLASLGRVGLSRVNVNTSVGSGTGPSLGSPRPGAAGSNTTSFAGGGSSSSSSSSSYATNPAASPTGSSLLAHTRLPVLAGSPKAAGAVSSSSSSSSISTQSGAFSAAATAPAAGGASSSARLGLAGSPGALQPGTPASPKAGSSSSNTRQFAGSLAAAAAATEAAGSAAAGPGGSLFMRHVDASKAGPHTPSSSSSIRAGTGAASKGGSTGAGTFSGGSSRGKVGAGSTATGFASQSSKDAAARRFR